MNSWKTHVLDIMHDEYYDYTKSVKQYLTDETEVGEYKWADLKTKPNALGDDY